LALDSLKDLKHCGLKTKKVLRPFLDLKDLKILILNEAKFQILKSEFWMKQNLTRKPIISMLIATCRGKNTCLLQPALKALHPAFKLRIFVQVK